MDTMLTLSSYKNEASEEEGPEKSEKDGTASNIKKRKV